MSTVGFARSRSDEEALVQRQQLTHTRAERPDGPVVKEAAVSLRDIMELGAKAYENGDLDGLVSSYAGNAVLESPEGRYEGLDAIREYWATNLSGISQASVELTTSVESGDVYFGEFRLRGTNTGDITLPDGTEIPATGKSLEISAVEMCRVSGDKIVEHKMWWDNLGAFAQLGLLPG